MLALTEFLRKEKVVGAYLEFYGEGAPASTLGDRATISNMAPEYGATAAMFCDRRPDARPTCASPAATTNRCAWSKPTQRQRAFWGDALQRVEYERVLKFDLSSVVRNMAGPSNPHSRLPTSALAERGIAGRRGAGDAAGPDARRRRDHRGHHQLHQHHATRAT